MDQFRDHAIHYVWWRFVSQFIVDTFFNVFGSFRGVELFR